MKMCSADLTAQTPSERRNRSCPRYEGSRRGSASRFKETMTGTLPGGQPIPITHITRRKTRFVSKLYESDAFTFAAFLLHEYQLTHGSMVLPVDRCRLEKEVQCIRDHDVVIDVLRHSLMLMIGRREVQLPQ